MRPATVVIAACLVTTGSSSGTIVFDIMVAEVKHMDFIAVAACSNYKGQNYMHLIQMLSWVLK